MLEATPITPTPVLQPSYLTVEQADAIAAGIYGVYAYTAASPGDRAKALATASARVDASRRWQGRKLLDEQLLEFPRLDGDRTIGVADPDTAEILAPADVRLAVVFEANSILSRKRDRIVAARHDGLTAQAIGSASESYAPVDGRGVPLLCSEADAAAAKYRLRSGRLL